VLLTNKVRRFINLLSRLIINAFFLTFINTPIGYTQPIFINDKDFPNEPAIGINRKNTNQILIGTAVGQAYWSNNGGKSFVQIPLDGEYGLWSDPSVFFDNKGNAYYFHLSGTKKGNSSDRIICQIKRKNDELFRVHSTIGQHPTACLERPMAVYNPYKNHIYLTYVIFDAYGSTNPQDSTRLYFTYSTNGGETWEPPYRLNNQAGDCSDRDSSVQGATIAFDKKGNIAVVWAANYGIWINYYHAATRKWLHRERLVAPQPNGWDFNIPHLKMPNGLPVVVNYTSTKENRLFVFWCQMNNQNTQSLVYYTYSNNGGNTWTQPTPLLETELSLYQFHVWASVHKNNLVVSCYEQLNNGNTYMRLFTYNSNTQKFSSFIVNNSEFNSDNEQYIGDMNQVIVYDHNIYLPFIKANKGTNSLYFIKY
jgi:hypothetical protein